MKLLTPAVTIFPALTMAKVLLAVGPDQALAIGDTCNVEWLVDSKMMSISLALLNDRLT